MRRASISALIPLFMLLQGCPVWGGGNEFGCATNTDCPTDYVCDTAGECQDPVCTIDDDCGALQRCENSLCLPDTDACRTDGDCDEGNFCDDEGRCTPSAECSPSVPCARPDHVCDFRGSCVPAPPTGQCNNADDCVGDELCIEGVCTDPNEACEFDFQCGAGKSCVNGECVIIGCGSNNDCPNGSTCSTGFCLPTPNQCTTSADCSNGDLCVGGRCLADCRDNAAACSALEVCGTDGFCRPDVAPSAFCSGDGDCAGGAVCRSGVCRTPCVSGGVTTCQMFDVQFDSCEDRGDGLLCYDSTEFSGSDCRVAADCSNDRNCVNGSCR